MPKAKKLPSGSWRCQVYLGKDAEGKNIYKSVTAETKKEAEYLAAEMQYKRKCSTTPSKMTLAQAIRNYIDLKENILSPETVRGYECILRNRFKSIMNVPIAKIDSKVLQAAINEESIKVSEKTVRNAYGLVIATMTMYAPENVLTVSLPPKEKHERRILTIDETRILLKSIQGDRAELSILLAMWLGLRASEIRGLKWNSYDNNSKTISVKQARVKNKDGVLVDGRTKTTESVRAFYLPGYICNKLDAARKNSQSEYIIDLPYHTEYKRLQAILKKNGIPAVTFHSLRHLNTSVMLLLGIPQKYAMERGGWSTPRTMQDIYEHTFDDEKKAVDDRVNSFFTSLLE